MLTSVNLSSLCFSFKISLLLICKSKRVFVELLHSCNLTSLEGRSRKTTSVQEFKASLGNKGSLLLFREKERKGETEYEVI